ncbi:MAG: hypothetical protein K2Q18_11545 [Bdellovibrionales bacterium]|nr:hypothetical protein [Bdellovibrionales bacterium]
MWYAGMRYANKVPASDDLMKIYKTSSKKVKQLMADGHTPRIEEIVECDTREDAAEYEYQFLKRCYKDKGWLNEALNNPFRKCDKKSDREHGNELNRKITGRPKKKINKKTKKQKIKDHNQKPYDPTHLAGAKPIGQKPQQKKSKLSRGQKKKLREIKGSIFYNGHD